jgi:hypothetical protein
MIIVYIDYGMLSVPTWEYFGTFKNKGEALSAIKEHKKRDSYAKFKMS